MRNLTTDFTNVSHNSLFTASPPTPPFNLTTTSHSSTPVAISWVATLDTPSVYTVTLSLLGTDSCNSFQVMVYNTTDNRSSLRITNLTSDGEYSVTVAGKNGAEQLGQKSEELRIGWTGT